MRVIAKADLIDPDPIPSLTVPLAIAFMRDNSALSDANIEAEVNRYISWPGQALAYKIRQLRTCAEKALAAKFDLRAFHDVVLGRGPVPLDMLEGQVNDWIAARVKR